MDIKETIFKLCELDGASGDEASVCGYAEKLLRKYTDNVVNKNGGVTAYIGRHDGSRPVVVLDAHIDQIGFIVTSVENGFAKAACLGGIDTRLLSAQRVTVHGRSDIHGVIVSIPPHLKGESAKVPDKSEIYIDISGRDSEVSAGDSVTFEVSPCELSDNVITAGALDDRCGMAAVLYALEKLDINALEYDIAAVFSSQEEIGERGAAMCAYDVNADIVIAVDVSFAYSEGENKTKCGELGKGCMIGISPSLDRELSRKLISIAEKENIPYQKEIMSGTTGTNADKYTVAQGGAAGATLSIPIRYMHTPAEVCDLNDVVSTGKLIAEFLKEAGKH